MERRKKAWMATFAAILIGHAYGKPSESVPIDEPPLVAPQHVDPYVMRETFRRLHVRTLESEGHGFTACTPHAPECP